jgi:citrate lyase subunit beta / citryl-CoA lyase
VTRSLLFVPGDSRRKFERALNSETDALILDLEDSVALAEKVAARCMVRASLEEGRQAKQLWVRVNPVGSELLLDDLVAVLPGRPYGIMLPKCSGRDDLLQLSHYLDALEVTTGVTRGLTHIIAIATETSSSLFALGTYANVTRRLWGIGWGAEDLAADVGSLLNRSSGRYTELYRLIRSMCLFAAASAQVRAIDTVCTDLNHAGLLATESDEAFRDGFSCKMAIHPNHVSSINKSFTPDQEKLCWARKVISTFERNPQSAAFNLDGMMIDLPHLRLARRLLSVGK